MLILNLGLSVTADPDELFLITTNFGLSTTKCPLTCSPAQPLAWSLGSLGRVVEVLVELEVLEVELLVELVEIEVEVL